MSEFQSIEGTSLDSLKEMVEKIGKDYAAYEAKALASTPEPPPLKIGDVVGGPKSEETGRYFRITQLRIHPEYGYFIRGRNVMKKGTPGYKGIHGSLTSQMYLSMTALTKVPLEKERDLMSAHPYTPIFY